MTDQPPSEQPAEETVGNQPAVPPPAAAAAPAPAAAPPPVTTPPPAAAPPPVTAPPSFDDASSGPSGLAAAFPPDRPERAAGAAFAGGLVLALILKRLAR